VKKFTCVLLMIAVILGACGAILPGQASAADVKPVVTISFSGYDEFRANIETVGKMGDNAGLAPFLETMLNMFTQGKGLVGLDKKAPWGAVVQLVDNQPVWFAFVPVSDLKQFMETAKASPVGQGITEADGVYEITANGQPMYVAQKGKIAAIVQDKAALDGVPADPEKLLGDLPQKYLVAVRATVKNIPEPQRDFALAMISAGLKQGMQRTEEETDEQFALREKTNKRTMEQMTMVFKETDDVVLGLNIDRKTNKVALDVEIIGAEGSKWATELSKAKAGKTNFAGFDLPNAAVVANTIGVMTDEDVADAEDTIKVMHDRLVAEVGKQELTEEQMKLAKEMLGEALAIVEKNVESKTSDAGMALCLDPAAVTFVAGAAVVDGKPIEALVKKFLDAAKEEEPAVADLVKFNAETYKGVRFHTLSVPTPPEAAELQPFVGDTIDVVLGVSDTQAFVAAGRDAAKILKQVIDKSQAEASKDVLPLQMTISALQIAKFVAAVVPDDDAKGKAQEVADALEKSGGKDHVIVTVESVANGMRLHVELEEGFMKMLGAASKSMTGGMGGMPGGPMPPESEK
jgi:hypothetical protein